MTNVELARNEEAEGLTADYPKRLRRNQSFDPRMTLITRMGREDSEQSRKEELKLERSAKVREQALTELHGVAGG
jgi:hypothetical protein